MSLTSEFFIHDLGEDEKEVSIKVLPGKGQTLLNSILYAPDTKPFEGTAIDQIIGSAESLRNKYTKLLLRVSNDDPNKKLTKVLITLTNSDHQREYKLMSDSKGGVAIYLLTICHK